MTTRAAAWLGSRWAPALAGLLAALLVFATWGFAAGAWPVMHDEWAYWTQAGQYARLRWSVPAPVLPEFFEQLYVLVTPVFAAKYWPGHAIVLAPGFAAGLPALMPLVLTAVTGALTFALARRVTNGWVAALTVLLWATTFGNLRFRASYFSELTTSAAWLAGWWALLEWRATRRTTWMVALAACAGWGAITRPATMFLFIIPVGVVVVRDVVRHRAWASLGAGLATGVALLGVLPLWSARVTGDWRTTPLAAYTRQYLPFDIPGTRVDTTSPVRALPAEIERVRGFLREIKVAQVTTPVWQTFVARARMVLGDAFGGWRAPFAIAFVLGCAVAGAAGWFALGTSVLLIVGYLTQAHTADWTVYYLEVFPVLAFIAAVGASRVARMPAVAGIVARPWVMPAAMLVSAVAIAYDTLVAHDTLSRISAHTRTFRAGVANLPTPRNVVFVRYQERRSMHISLVANDGTLGDARAWIVHDRGSENAGLIAAAPDRTPWIYDEATNTFAQVRP